MFCTQTVHRKRSKLSFLLALAPLLACGGGEVPPPVAPGASGPSAPNGSAVAPASALASPTPAPDPFALPVGPRDDGAEDPDAAPLDLAAWKKARAGKGVPPPAAACTAFAHRAASKDGPGLIEAFSEQDPAKRDARLVAVGKIPQIAGAWPIAVRADFAPVECADAITDSYLDALSTAPSENPATIRLVVGFSLAGKLARTAATPPAMGALRDKEKVKAFITGPLKAWLVEQSLAIELLSSGAAGLSGYARGIAAIEAGIAEMRLVDQMRSAPVPAGWDVELKSIYEAALDEALEPRKKRGRDAALVGLSDFAKLGILRDRRIGRARALLSKLYGGRRIDALDGLLLPARPAPSTATPKDAAIAGTPLYWLDFRELGLGHDPRTLTRGLTRGVREDVRKLASAAAAPGAADDLRAAYARTRLDLGRVYWRRVDFVEAAHAARAGAKPEDRLVLALSLALVRGPNGAAEMMRAATPSMLDLKHTEALDVIAAEGGPMAGMAAYDAAHVRALSPPDGDDAPAYLQDVAARFRKAATLLTDPAQKKNAAARAVEIEMIGAVTGGKSDTKQ